MLDLEREVDKVREKRRERVDIVVEFGGVGVVMV